MSRMTLAFAAAAALAIPQAALLAQDSITVTGSGARAAGVPADGVGQRLELVADVKVHYADLDLTTRYGRATLEQRARLAAHAACDRIDAIDPPVGPGGLSRDAGDCRQIALRHAESEVRRAISAAG